MISALLILEFIGPCSSRPILKAELRDYQATVGHTTVAVLDKKQIPYLGTIEGINSVFGTPYGMDAMEVVSDTEMRSYGWCYKVDGEIPEVFPHLYPITPQTKRVSWFYGFAHYLKGEWVSQCEPAHKIKPAFLCSSK